MRYALIGCGRISRNHIEAARLNHLNISGLCDLVPEKTAEIKGLLNLPELVPEYTDYKKMLKEQKPELVAIATESGRHAEIALDCISAGCHVIIEKPIALSLRDADRIILEAERKQVKVCACHQNRFNKSIQKIREAVEEGRFGRMLYGTAHVRWNRGKEYYEQAPWRGTWEQDGGALMNQCIHNVDLLRWMMGQEVEEVTGYTAKLTHTYLEAEDLGMALVKFKNGAYGIIEGTTNVYPRNLEETLYLFGEKGTVKAAGKSVNRISEWEFADQKDNPDRVKDEFHEDPPNVYGYGHNPLYADMIEAIQKNRKPYIDGKAGRDALEMILGIYKSQKEGRAVTFPLEDFSSLDMQGTFGKGK